MESVDPVRGPQLIPRIGRFPNTLLPRLHEVMVLRSRAGQLVALPRGTSPTLGQRLSGTFIEAYYVDCGESHSRTFSVRLPSGDIGVDLLAEIDVELRVEDSLKAVIEHRSIGYLKDVMAAWVQHHASRLTYGFKVARDNDLASLAGQILVRLQTENQGLNFSGLKIRELRVRLRLADEKTVAEAGAITLAAKLRAQRIKDLHEIYASVSGADLARIMAAVTADRDSEMVAFLHAMRTWSIQIGQQPSILC